MKGQQMRNPSEDSTLVETRHGPPNGQRSGGRDLLGDGGARQEPTLKGDQGKQPSECSSCRQVVERLVRSYWGPELCPECVAGEVAERDAAHSWPVPWWEAPAPAHVAVLGAEGLWRCNQVHKVLPHTLERLGELVESLGVEQVWVHDSAFTSLGFPPSIHAPRSGAGLDHHFTRERGEWLGGARGGLRDWGDWYKRNGWGFDLHIPSYGRGPFRECGSACELLGRVAQFDAATGHLPWKGTGAVTSDAYLRRRLRRVLRPTEHPEPITSGSALERPALWHREPTLEEARRRRLYAFDLNLAYAAPASSLPLPLGECRHVEWPTFDAKMAGVYLVEVEGETRWVTAPTLQRLEGKGKPALEGYVWPDSRRHLRPWYELVRDARVRLLEGGGPALDAVKDVCREGLGRMASKVRTLPEGKSLADDPTFQPYWCWAVIAEARERLMDRVEAMPASEVVAVDTDCVFILSGSRSAGAAAVRLGLPLGTGLGQFKVAGIASGWEAREVLAERRTSRAVAGLRELVK